jgi:competence protein ComEA
MAPEPAPLRLVNPKEPTMIRIRSLFAAALALCAAAAFAAVDVNQAKQADLESIKGIGPSLSERVLAERGKSPFADWGDLQTRVKGIGPGNAARFSAAGLTVNGVAYAPQAQPVKPAKQPRPAKADKPAKAEAPRK